MRIAPGPPVAPEPPTMAIVPERPAPVVPQQPEPAGEEPREWAQNVSDRRPSPVPRPHRPAWGGMAEPGQALVPRQDPQDRLPVPVEPKQTRRERRIAERGGKDGGGLGQLLLVGGIALAIVIAAITGGILLITGGEDESSVPDAGDAPVADTCTVEGFGLACLEEPRCFNGDLVDGDDLAAADPVSCEEQHVWEAYALGEVSGDLPSATYGDVRKDELVSSTCLAPLSEGPLSSLLGNAASDWQSDVLPPDPAAFEDGNREFLCVARLQTGEPVTGTVFG